MNPEGITVLDEKTIASPHPALTLGYKPQRTFRDLEARLENALRIMANVITKEGEAYLPIFQRLETELEQYRSKQAALKRALSLSENR